MWTFPLIDYRWISDGTTISPVAPIVNISLSDELTAGDVTVSNLSVLSGVYTDASSRLTDTPPSSGVLGYWTRAGTVVSPANVGDTISTTGLITVLADGSTTTSFIGVGAEADLILYHDGMDSFILNRLAGSDLTILAVTPSATGGTGTNAGDMILSGGTGGDTTAPVGADGGVGGDFSLSGGTGGAGSGIAGTGGDGGDVNLTAGAGGTGGTQGDGGNANITVGTGLTEGCVNFIGSETLVLDLSVADTATYSSSSGIATISFSAINLTTTGNVSVDSSSNKFLAGATQDFEIFYDGTYGRLDGTGEEIRIGDDTTNCTAVEPDGTIRFEGAAIVWDDLRVPLSAAKRLGFSDPDWEQFQDDGAGSVGVYEQAFSNTIDQELFFDRQLPHSYREGTDIRPHVHWSPSTAGAGNVTWKLEYTWVNIDGTFGTTTTIAVTDATDTTALKHHKALMSNIDGTGKTMSSMLLCRLYRDVSDGDTYAADAFALEIDFHYQKDTVGSREELTK